jgi:polyisoprenoid-binding protein YceI
MLRRILIATAITAIMLPAFAAAEVAKFKIDRVHSEVTFTIRHLVSKTTGRFNDFAGEIAMDPKDPSTLSAEATIQAASIDTNSDKRDGHLKSADFFEVEKYPTITFKSTKVAKVGDKWVMTGDLTMKDVTKPVSLDLTILGVLPNGQRAGFEATGRIDRKDFGVTYNNVVEGGGTVLGDDVDLTIRVEAVNAAAETAAKK